MDEFERILEIERGASDFDSGEFPMILATEGEASDGHILSIKGGVIPDRMPLLFGHRSEPQLPALGSVIEPSKGRKDGVAILRARGRVNMNGEEGDALLPTRRGIMQLIHDGDLSQVSIRWDGVKATRRTMLPKGHKFHVDENDETEARWGMLFDEWTAREGSVVGLGADPKALIGRSQASDDELETLFFRVLGEQAPNQDGLLDVTSAVRMVSVHARNAAEPIQVPLGGSVYAAVWDELCESLRATAALQAAAETQPEKEHSETSADSDPETDHAEPLPERAEVTVIPRRTMSNVPREEYQRLFAEKLGEVTARTVSSITGRKVTR